MNEPSINYKIISSNKITSFAKPASVAMSHIRKYMQDNPSWLYIDGQPTVLEDLTPLSLQKASSIIVSKELMGG